MCEKFQEDVFKLRTSFVTSAETVVHNAVAKTDDELKTVKNILVFLEQHFVQLSKAENLKDFLRILHQAVKLEDGASISNALEPNFRNLIKKYQQDESYLLTLVQILYQILKTVAPSSSAIKENIFNDLLDKYFLSKDKILKSNILKCLEVYIEKFNPKEFIKNLKDKVKGSADLRCETVQLLVQLFDVLNDGEFYQTDSVTEVIRKLLVSDIREYRKSSYYLLKKRIEVVSTQSQTLVQLHDNEQNFWTTYITIVENLDENQSHLILPSLENLKLIQKASNRKIWLDILYMKLLQQDNILVIRWSLEFMLSEFTADCMSCDLLQQFLVASNDTRLYNKEGYFLSEKKVQNFLNCKDYKKFLDLFVNVAWKSVPLHFWLTQLISFKTLIKDSMNNEILLKMAGKIRILTNSVIRGGTISVFRELFLHLHINEYVKVIEALYNLKDAKSSNGKLVDEFFLKLTKCNDPENVLKNSKHVFDILAHYLSFNEHSIGYIPEVLVYLNQFTKEKHGWLRMLFTFYLMNYSNEVKDFVSSHYDINLHKLNELSLVDLTAFLCTKLVVERSDEIFVKQKAVDFYALHSKKFKIEQLEILEQCSTNTLMTISKKLIEYNGTLDVKVLDVFVSACATSCKLGDVSSIVENVLAYCKNQMPLEVQQIYANKFLEIAVDNLRICQKVLSSNVPLKESTLMDGILLGPAKTGDDRIEEVYLGIVPNFVLIRELYLKNLPANRDIVQKLLDMNNKINKEKPRHFENSKEHRLKLRIAIALYEIAVCKGIDLEEAIDGFWDCLLNQNNHVNVTCIYESILANIITNMKPVVEILKKISSYTASQQTSIISVVHFMCILKKVDSNYMNEFIKYLLPLTMGANFNTRLLAQLTIYNVINNCDINNPELKEAIEIVIADKMTEFMQNIRIQMPNIQKSRFCFDIMYITNTPYDENSTFFLPKSCPKLSYIREIFLKNRNSSKALNSIVQNQSLTVQRKMNPVDDFTSKSNLISYPECDDYEMFVVASLIDKIPNLGGIARTCEVLGIKNMVMDSKKHVEKNDFKNLSMTAEKSLNIIEIKPAQLPDFLIEKRCEGFQIVGAEQTSNSQSFVNFKFPKKCVLLLGHEKEGLPPNLLGFLDDAVEIPQFGLVRSLNVHVTGALFMWEYCKQHIARNY